MTKVATGRKIVKVNKVVAAFESQNYLLWWPSHRMGREEQNFRIFTVDNLINI